MPALSRSLYTGDLSRNLDPMLDQLGFKDREGQLLRRGCQGRVLGEDDDPLGMIIEAFMVK